jgi:hypothetical protein
VSNAACISRRKGRVYDSFPFVPLPRCPRKLLSRRKIYVIRATDETPRRWEAPGWGVHVEGIHVAHPAVKCEWAMNPKRFRPVVDRPTNIYVFKKLLAGSPASTPRKRKKPTRPVQLELPL